MQTLDDIPTHRWTNRLSWLALAFAVLVMLGTFFTLSFYAHPQGDDFDVYDNIRTIGLVDTIKKSYNGWTGRYFYIAFEGAIITQMDLIEDFWLVGISTISLLIFSMYALIRTITRGLYARWQAFGLAIGLFTVYLAMLPIPARAFYWLTGAATNQLVLITGMFSFALLLRDPTHMSKLKQTGLIVGASLLMAAAIGSYDNTIPMLDGMLLGATALALITRDPRRLQISTVFIVALVCSAIVLRAPGNGVRASHFEKAPLLQAIDYSITNALKWSVPYLLSPTVLLASLLFLPVGWRIGRRLREIAGGKPRWMLLVVALWALMILFSWLPAQYVMQGNPPPRTRNTISLFLLIGLFGSIAAICAQVPDRSQRTFSLPTGLMAATRFLLAAALLTQGNGNLGIVQLKSEVRLFHATMHERYNLIRQAKARGETDIVIPPLPVQPTLLLPTYPVTRDINANPKDYPNHAACHYWQIDSIRTDEALLQDAHGK